MILYQSGALIFLLFVVMVDTDYSSDSPEKSSCLNCFFPPVFLVAPPSSAAHLQCSSAPQQGSPAPLASLPSSLLQDKHQKPREHQGLCGFLASVPSLPLCSSPSPDFHPSHCHNDDSTKPKGKRPYKTKHTEGEIGQEEAEVGGAEDKENTMVRKVY